VLSQICVWIARVSGIGVGALTQSLNAYAYTVEPDL
jgi:hypothetical protein